MLRFGLKQSKVFSMLSTLLYCKTQFKPVPQRINLPQEEEKILEYWKEAKAFEAQLEKTKDNPPFSFYDGPPFATGTPHYGHIAAGTIKDVVCRYASQTGHYVERRFGWDCHGLPVEYEIDKQLKITDRRQVTEMGIKKYNQACRGIVMRYSHLWESIVGRFGRWIDFKNDYKTMDLKFMESVWYVFKQMYDKGLVYRGRKIMPYSNACSTVLSNFEVQQNYKSVDDPSILITFPLVSDSGVKLVAWTTTPWTLPSNLVLAVNPAFTYVKIQDIKRKETFIVAESRLKQMYSKNNEYTVLEKIKGADLEGIEYEPLYSFFEEAKKDGCFRVQLADFVTDSDGTGIVHCAPGFGQDDYKLCVSKGLVSPDSPPVPLDENGRFTKQMGHLAGIYIKGADDMICKQLKEKGRLIRKGVIRHNYPFCWRSQTPLIYKAVSAWFVRVTDSKSDLVRNNHKAYWVPSSIQQKKFDNWLKDAKDWCFSRNRFWGNPIPLWVSDDGEQVICVGSVAELEQLTGQKITDLHRESIDGLTIKSRKGKGYLRRIEQVFDCWFESGSMPFAQNHYPFSTNEQTFNKTFPADFIGQGIDQTRGWFYTLNVISTAIRNTNPYKNLIVNGLVLTESGKKMSKRLKNYPDPVEVCNQIGADAVRLYLINSPLVKADNLNFSKEGVRGVVRDVFLPWYNAYRFLIMAIEKWQDSSGQDFIFKDKLQQIRPKFNVTDQWIESSLQELLIKVRKEMEAYHLYNVVPALLTFLNDLTNWYLRLNRSRLKGEQGKDEQTVSLNVLFDVLVKLTVLMSPHVPFITEHIYQNMKLVIDNQSDLSQSSIHHVNIPTPNRDLIQSQVISVMQQVMGVIETARKLRQNKQISLKQPIKSLKIITKDQSVLDRLKPFLQYILSEVNVEDVIQQRDVQKFIKLSALPNLPVLGPKLKGTKLLGPLRKAITELDSTQISKFMNQGNIQIEGYKLGKDEIIVSQKFIEHNLESYEAIGGQQTIVLIDCRQDEELKSKGLARQLITRCQKLKKKASISGQDQVIFFFHLPRVDSALAKAISEQSQLIQSSIKRPFVKQQSRNGLQELAIEEGSIDDEPYRLVLCRYGPILELSTIKTQFGDEMGEKLAEIVMEVPLEQIIKIKAVAVHQDGKEFHLKQGVHFKLI